MKTDIELLEEFRKSKGMTIARFLKAAKTIDGRRRVTHYTLPYAKAVDLYRALVQPHGERCNICKKKVPFGVPSLLIASRSKRNPLPKNPTIHDAQLICKKDAKVFFANTYKRK